MTAPSYYKDGEKRMFALFEFCRARNIKMPKGDGLTCALEMIGHTPYYGRRKAGNKHKPANRSIHVFLLIEYL